MLLHHSHLIPTDFEILSEKIVELFPTETKSTYYIPRIPATNTPSKTAINAKGKLIDKYRNLRRLYNLNDRLNISSTSSNEQQEPNIADAGKNEL